MSRCKADATGVNDPPPPPRVYLIMFYVFLFYFFPFYFYTLPYTYIFYTGSNTFRRRIRRTLGGKGRGDDGSP